MYLFFSFSVSSCIKNKSVKKRRIKININRARGRDGIWTGARFAKFAVASFVSDFFGRSCDLNGFYSIFFARAVALIMRLISHD